MEWPIAPQADVVPPPDARMPERRRVVARRLAGVVFVAAFLVDLFGDPQLVAAVSRLCGS